MSGHGKRSTYVRGCRCEPCTVANRDYAREMDRHYRRRRYGIEPPRPDQYVDAAEAREHLRWLSSVGIGSRTVAARSGVSRSAVTDITNGEHSRIRVTTAAKILAVGKSDRAAVTLVDAADTWRKVDELVAHGWTKVAIARRVYGPKALGLPMRRSQILARTADRVAALHASALAHVIAERQLAAERQAAYRAAKRKQAAA